MDQRALALTGAGDAPLEVLVLTDGVAGHDRSSDGIVAALGRLRPVCERWLGVTERRPGSRRFARVAAALAPPGAWLARNVAATPARVAPALADRAVPDWPDRADIVVSTGPSTAAMNVAAARRYGARNVYYGYPKWPHLGYTLMLSSVQSSHVTVAPRPSRIDAAALPPPRPIAGEGPRSLALLIGGDTKHYAYTAADMEALAAALCALADRHPHWRVEVYDSRRTPPSFAAFLAATDALRARIAVNLFSAGGAFSNTAAYGVDLILVTADSLSMVSEAIAAGRPTLVVRADAYDGPARDRAELDALAAAGLIGRTTFAAIDDAALVAAPRPPATSQIDALAGILAARGF